MTSSFSKIPLFNNFLMSLSKDILKNTFLIACQHLLEDTHLLMLALNQLGLKREHVAIIGKCYSTNPEVVAAMRADGLDVFTPEVGFDSHISFDEQFKEHIHLFITAQKHKINSSSFERIIVLDDGGELITAMHESFPDADNLVGIEQTTSGINKINCINQNFPVVNVARCQAKLTHESPVIAQTILKQLKIYLKDHRLIQKNALILGNGAIGNALRKYLKLYYPQTKIYDLDFKKSELTDNEFISYLKQADIIFGCTGFTSLSYRSHEFLKKNVILASASSSDREFDAVYLRKNHPKVLNCHANMVINSIHLLNCGFPINFSGEQSISLFNRQLVMSLLLAATCQAKKLIRLDRHMIHLDTNYERYIMRNHQSLHNTSDNEIKNINYFPILNNLGEYVTAYSTSSL